MADFISAIDAFIAHNKALLMTWAPAVGLLALALILMTPVVVERYRHWRLRRRIQALGCDSLHDVVISDGLDGQLFIENLVLTPQAILVMPLKRYHGVVFAADNIDIWTQVLGKRSYKFPNPLPELDSNVGAVRALLPGVPVEGRLLVAAGASFPKGKPARLLPVSETPVSVPECAPGSVPARLQQAWARLGSLAEPADVRLAPDLREQQESRRLRTGFAMALLLAAIGWLVWRSQQ